MFCGEHFVVVHGGVETCSHGCSKARDEIPEGYDLVWPQICERSEDILAGIC